LDVGNGKEEEEEDAEEINGDGDGEATDFFRVDGESKAGIESDEISFLDEIEFLE